MRERILVVEDESLIALDLEDRLHRLGYLTSGVARDFQSAKLLAPYSDIALVDLNLADGATGPRVAQYLIGEFGIPVVMITSSSQAIEEGLSKVARILSKPMNQTPTKKLNPFLTERWRVNYSPS
jgi:CheY-like chemotaxis protein